MRKLKTMIANVLNVDPDQILSESSPQTIASWDSMAGLKMITELEKGYSVEFTMDEVLSVKRFGDIVEILNKRGIVLSTDDYA